MIWSKLRSAVEARFAPSLRGRVALRQARYRYTREEVGRVWFLVDGEDAASYATGRSWPAVAAEAERLMDARGHWGSTAAYTAAVYEAEDVVRAAGVYDDQGALRELEAFLSMPVEDALAAPSPLLRALAVLDAPVGKRRLRALAAAPDPDPLVRRLLALRCGADGLPAGAPAA